MFWAILLYQTISYNLLLIRNHGTLLITPNCSGFYINHNPKHLSCLKMQHHSDHVRKPWVPPLGQNTRILRRPKHPNPKPKNPNAFIASQTLQTHNSPLSPPESPKGRPPGCPGSPSVAPHRWVARGAASPKVLGAFRGAGGLEVPFRLGLGFRV